MRFVRDWFTDELKEVPYEETPNIVIGEVRKNTGNPWDKGHVSRTLGVHPEQAEEFTKQARMMGNQDVTYDRNTGFCISTSRDGFAAESVRRQYWHGSPGDVESKYAKLLGK